MKDILIGRTIIGSSHKPFIIAEISGNHGGSKNRAMELIKSVADTGADAVKFQTYRPDTITIKSDRDEFYIDDKNSLWHGRTLYDLYDEAHTPWEWHKDLFKYAKSLGLEVFSSPFDLTAVDFLEDLDVSAYKIASLEIGDVQLIQRVAETKKPIIISTGAASISEIEHAVRIVQKHNPDNLILLKCTSAYPALPENANLNSIRTLSSLYSCHVGLSDHTLGSAVAIASVSLGALVVEKHFIDSKKHKTVDSAFSLDSKEFTSLVNDISIAWKSLGKASLEVTTEETTSQSHKRSLYVVNDISKGEKFTLKNLKSIRPSNGLPVKYLNSFLGKRSTENISKGTPLRWKFLEDDL